ncbi:MAG: hypothetical protein ABIN97_05405, partial [Ginsengibacter sp.]
HPVSVSAKNLKPSKTTKDDLENMVVTITYSNGSIGNLLYLTQGDNKVPKEYIEVFGGGITLQLENFERLQVFAEGKLKTIKGGNIDKGQKDEMKTFVDAIKNSTEMPISVDSLLDTTLVTLAAALSATTNRTINLEEFWNTTQEE